jgi:hypothetical protein
MRGLGFARVLWLAVLTSCHLLNLILQGLQVGHLIPEIILFCPASLPAVAPVQNEELEAKGIDLDCRLEADAQIVVVHLVELRARV